MNHNHNIAIVGEVMREARNFFSRDSAEGSFSINGHTIDYDVKSPFIAISGSRYHDGVWMVSAGCILFDDLPSEDFEGTVYSLDPPAGFLAICDEIAEYNQKSPVGSLQSETLGNYSYTRSFAGDGGVKPWEDAFRSRINRWRRMFPDIDL